MVIRLKKQKHCSTPELEVGDCWISLSVASSSDLILAARVSKHTDAFIEQLVINTTRQNSLPAVQHRRMGRLSTSFPIWSLTSHRQRQNTAMFVRTNGTMRQQTGRWHRRQNKFSKASVVSGSTERSPNVLSRTVEYPN